MKGLPRKAIPSLKSPRVSQGIDINLRNGRHNEEVLDFHPSVNSHPGASTMMQYHKPRFRLLKSIKPAILSISWLTFFDEL